MSDSITPLEQPATTPVFLPPRKAETCVVCGFPLTHKDKSAIYCSTKCQKKANWQRIKMRDALVAAAKLQQGLKA